MSTIARLRSRTIVILRKFLSSIASIKLYRYPALQNLLEKFNKSKSAAIDSADAIGLYEHILSIKPNCILELGPGTSTNIICLAIDEVRKADPSYSPKFLSFEENSEWLIYHEENFQPELRKYVTLGFMPAAKKASDALGENVAHYSNIPKLPYDFIFVDGPDFLSRGCTWSSDVIDLAISCAQTVSIVFDGREHTVRQSWKRLKIQGFKLRRNFYSLSWEIYRK